MCRAGVLQDRFENPWARLCFYLFMKRTDKQSDFSCSTHKADECLFSCSESGGQ